MSSKALTATQAGMTRELPVVRSGVGAPVSFTKAQPLPAEGSDNSNPRPVRGQFYLAPTSDAFIGDEAHAELDVAFRAIGGEFGGVPRVPKFDQVTGMAVSAALGETPDARAAAVVAGVQKRFPDALVRQIDRPQNAAHGEHHEPGFVQVVRGGRLLNLVVTQTGFEELIEGAPGGAPGLPKKKP